MSATYNTLPFTPKGKVEPFELRIDEQKVADFKQLLRLSPVAKDCYENQEEQKEKGFGVTRKWLVHAKSVWENEFDWYVLFAF